MRVGLAFAVLLSIACGAHAVRAQQLWLSDRRLSEGPGIRTGNLELHPGIAGETGYDSNYFQRAGGAEEVLPALRFRLTPSLSLSSLSSTRLGPEAAGRASTRFQGRVYATYNEIIATDSKHSSAFADQRDVSAGADASALLLQDRPFSVDLAGAFQRQVEPSNSVDPDQAFDRDALRLGGGVTWRPGGGLFRWRLGYGINYVFFERLDFSQYTNFAHSLQTRGSWRFLPRTELVYDGEYYVLRYADPTAVQDDGEVVTSRVGLNGLVTKYFGLSAFGGIAVSFYGDPDSRRIRNFDDWVAEGTATWYLQPQAEIQPTSAPVGLSAVSVGFVRDFHPSYLGAFYQRMRGHARVTYGIAGRVVLAAEGGFSRLGYPRSYFANGQQRSGGFSENRVDVKLFAEYRLSDTFGINVSGQYDQNITGRKIPAFPGGPAEDLEFSRWQAYLGARWFL